MTRITLMMIASAAVLLAQPAMETNNKPMIMTKTHGVSPMMRGQGMSANKMMMQKNMMKGNMAKKKMNSPFLIKHGLPHLSKMIMPYMNDPAFNLTADQKEQLSKVRITTMTAIMEAKPKVMALRKEIVNASASGVSTEELKDKVAKLALLEAAATMTHLKCIESTKAILTKNQLYFLLANKNKKMNHGKKRMMGNKCKGKMNMGQKPMMKNCKCRMNNK
jgi:hypothetical protein